MFIADLEGIRLGDSRTPYDFDMGIVYEDMSIEAAKMERLAYIKNLHENAIALSREPSPNRSASLLSFHDSVEMFLILSTQHVDAKKPDHFMEYWWELEKIDVSLTQKESMRNLHDARNNLKHQFMRPSDEDIEVYRSITRRFFEENTTTVFGINYEEISMASLVDFETTRRELEEARELLSDGQTREAAISLDDAFSDMLYEYRERGSNQFGYSPIPKRQDPIIDSSYSDDVQEWIDKSTGLIDNVYSEMQIIALGLNYEDYSRFNNIVKNARRMGKSDDDFKKEEIEFGVQFVVRAALTIQQTQVDLSGDFQHPQTGNAFDW